MLAAADMPKHDERTGPSASDSDGQVPTMKRGWLPRSTTLPFHSKRGMRPRQPMKRGGYWRAKRRDNSHASAFRQCTLASAR